MSRTQPETPMPAEARPAPASGQRFGAWTLERLLGRGGMGEVWLARRHDGLYEAQAAIKLLRPDQTGPGLLARFARERALLGRLQHPGIARLLDAGVQDEQAYLVIEYVAGLTLSDYIAMHQPDVATRVALLLELARAVEYAHAQLVVHRDLKPGNVMVDDAGHAHLLDFGVAGLLDEEAWTPSRSDGALTRLTGRRLTPAYAAPEQILGQPIGVAADVYGLGVMLFELLTGSLPYRVGLDASPQAVEHAVLHSEPQRFTEALEGDLQLQTLVPPPDALRGRGDLEAIAAKALHKAPEQRYPSVRALIEDLERWQQHRPVSVRQEVFRHRIQLWLRRHRALALGTSALTLSLGLGLATTLWQWQRAEAQGQRAQRAIDYITELMATGNPQDNKGQPPTVVELLDRSSQDLDQRFADDPELQLQLLGTLRYVNHGIGREDRAVAQGEKELALARRLYGPTAQVTMEAAWELAKACNTIGLSHRVVALTEGLDENSPIDELKRPRGRTFLLLLRYSALIKQGQFETAEAMLPAIRQAMALALPAGDMPHGELAGKIALLRYSQGRYREAEAALDEALSHWDKDLRIHAIAPYTNRRVLLMTQMRRLKPLDFPALVQDFSRDAERLFGPGTELVLGLHADLAQWHLDLGQTREAARIYRELLALHAQRPATLPAVLLPRQANALLAEVLAAEQAPEALQQQAQNLLGQLEAETLLQGPSRGQVWLTLARIGLQVDPALADRALNTLQTDATLDIATHPMLRSRLDHLQGLRARQLGELARSREHLLRRVADLDRVDEPDQLPRWQAQLDLSDTLLALGDAAAARTSLKRASALRPASLAPGHPLDRQSAQLQLALGRLQLVR